MHCGIMGGIKLISLHKIFIEASLFSTTLMSVRDTTKECMYGEHNNMQDRISVVFHGFQFGQETRNHELSFSLDKSIKLLQTHYAVIQTK